MTIDSRYKHLLEDWREETIRRLDEGFREQFHAADSVLMDFADKAENINIQKVIEEARDIVYTGVSALLLDSKTSSMPAGTGVSFEWKIAREVRQAIDVPLIIAGGLNSKNIRDAIENIRPFGVDVISGVEEVPGKKSRHKVAAFIQAVNGLKG